VSERALVRALFLTSDLVVGGAEKHTIELANGVDPNRVSPSLGYIKAEAPLLPQIDRTRVSDVFCCNGTRGIDWQAAKTLACHIDKLNTEVVVCTNLYPMMIATIAQQFTHTRFKLLEVFHSTAFITLKERLQMRVYNPFIRRCDLMVFVCENQRRHWHDKRYANANRETVIHNGVDIDEFAIVPDIDRRTTCRAQAGFKKDDYVIGICASLRPEKRHLDLLSALARMRRRNNQAKLLIIGDGAERAAIELKIEELGLSRAVYLAGFQSNVRPWVESCDVMALCSLTEAFSIAALEAMAQGKPMVMTDVGGANEQITHGVSGLLYQPGDIDALTTHLELLSSYALQMKMGAAARQNVQSKFTLRRMLGAYEDAIVELVSHAPSSRYKPS
jgi:glycosyltransferase involved in cell wall biosynthesis